MRIKRGESECVKAARGKRKEKREKVKVER
jgi:hypothetical protein